MARLMVEVLKQVSETNTKLLSVYGCSPISLEPTTIAKRNSVLLPEYQWNGDAVDDLGVDIIDVTSEAQDIKYRKLIKPENVIIHRIGPELECADNECEYCSSEQARDNSKHHFGLHVSDWFQSHRSLGGTGGENPYHIVVDFDKIFQCMPLNECGVHARRWNSSSIAVAVRGDFSIDHPTPYQKEAVRSLCGILTAFLGRFNIMGHTELAYASNDPMKVCPGKFLYMDNIRTDSRPLHNKLRNADNLVSAMLNSGFIFEHKGEQDGPN
jgi:hypothetical protein